MFKKANFNEKLKFLNTLFMAMFYPLLALCLSGSALGQIASRGACPRIQVPTNIESSKLMGRWYEIEKVYANFELAAKCTTVNYSAGKNNTVNVVDSYISGITGKRVTYSTTIYVPDPKKNPGKHLIKFPLTPHGAISKQYILGTDNETFAVVYSCTEWSKHNLVYLWILTRQRNPEKDVLNKAYRVLAKNRISRANMFKVEQDNCGDDDDCSDEK